MTDLVLQRGNIPAEELDSAFLQGMVNRRLMGYRKYGSASARTADRPANVRERLERYAEDGNTEWLIDAAVFAWIEFMYPMHPKAHFRATSTAESRGTLLVDGTRDMGAGTTNERARLAYGEREGD